MSKTAKSPKKYVSKQEQQQSLRMKMIAAGAAVVLLAVIIVVVLLANRRVINNSGILTYEIQGREHIEDAYPHPPYNSNPPTSGPHYAVPADWGIYHEALPDEQLVHNLEHGGIWISYRDASDTATIQQLEAIVNSLPNSYFILTYRPNNDWPIAVAAWGKVIKFDGVDADKIMEFARSFMYQGPEKV